MDFVEICNVCTRKVIIKAAKRISNSDKICGSYCDFYFGVTFLEHTTGYIVVTRKIKQFQIAIYELPYVNVSCSYFGLRLTQLHN